MTDKLNDQISAFIDDELMSEESELLVRRLCTDDALRKTAARYTLMGNAIRGSLHEIRADLNGNIMRAIEAEQLPVAPQEAVAATGSWRRLAGGGALAAAVAVIAVLAIRPAQAPTDIPERMQVAQQSTPLQVVPADRDGARPFNPGQSPVAPLVVPASTQSQAQAQLERYLLRHNQYSKTSMRQGVLIYRTMAGEDTRAAQGNDAQPLADGDVAEQ